jgi:site-specific recombinase XerD
MDVVYLFRDSDCVRIPFTDYDPALFRLLIFRDGAKWDNVRQEFTFKDNGSADHCWNFPVPFVKVEEISGSIQVFQFLERPVNITSNVNMLLHNLNPVSTKNINLNKPIDSPFTFPVPSTLPEKFSGLWLKKLDAELRSRKYSRCTQKAYIYYNRLICRTLQKTPEEIRSCDVTEFIALMEKDNNYTSSAMNLALSAIKFFFRNVLKKDDINDHHRPQKDGRLPMILSKEEITKMLGMEKNPKHRLLLMLVYSSGLRVSEVVALKKEHIDLSRKVIYIRLGKGRKDRSTLLSEKAAQFIEEYYNFFEIEKWLFPGQPPTRPLSIRSAQHIFDKALSRAGIIKRITIHGLRHAFATHLLESGTDIRYIQTLLGHANIRTTERYTHVARRNVLSIKSPLDTI